MQTLQLSCHSHFFSLEMSLVYTSRESKRGARGKDRAGIRGKWMASIVDDARAEARAADEALRLASGRGRKRKSDISDTESAPKRAKTVVENPGAPVTPPIVPPATISAVSAVSAAPVTPSGKGGKLNEAQQAANEMKIIQGVILQDQLRSMILEDMYRMFLTLKPPASIKKTAKFEFPAEYPKTTAQPSENLVDIQERWTSWIKSSGIEESKLSRRTHPNLFGTQIVELTYNDKVIAEGTSLAGDAQRATAAAARGFLESIK